MRSYFRDVDDHLVTVTDRVAGFNELLTTLVDAVLAKIDHAAEQRHAQDHRVGGDRSRCPTMIAGIYGMNFDLHARAALDVTAIRWCWL